MRRGFTVQESDESFRRSMPLDRFGRGIEPFNEERPMRNDMPFRVNGMSRNHIVSFHHGNGVMSDINGADNVRVGDARVNQQIGAHFDPEFRVKAGYIQPTLRTQLSVNSFLDGVGPPQDQVQFDAAHNALRARQALIHPPQSGNPDYRPLPTAVGVKSSSTPFNAPGGCCTQSVPEYDSDHRVALRRQSQDVQSQGFVSRLALGNNTLEQTAHQQRLNEAHEGGRPRSRTYQ